MSGRLVLCATPIGNLDDISPRLAEVLSSADLVLAEDTRRTRKLLTALDIDAQMRSFFAGNERARLAELAERLGRGETIALVTDAGTPAVSDPGSAAVAVARRLGAAVSVVPGPSAVTAAVAASGLVDGPFVFEGFLARRGPQRSAQLAALASETRPTIFFLSPHRLVDDLGAIDEAIGKSRTVCVARELTKLHEEVWWGTAADAAGKWRAQAPRGEFTLVVAGASPSSASLAEAVEAAKRHRDQGESASQAARKAAAETGVTRRAIFDALVEGDEVT